MVWIPGGTFSMGSEDPTGCICGGSDPMADARPIHQVAVDGFWMDKTEVTNAQWEAFVKATGYRTIAEIAPTREEFPTAPAENLVAGSTVFTPTAGPVRLNNMLQWWRYEVGADWRHPEGPKSDILKRPDYPVVHIAYPDAEAYAKWAGKRIPTEFVVRLDKRWRRVYCCVFSNSGTCYVEGPKGENGKRPWRVVTK
jgi:formylglycine-generating enzyme required for sulfatase activity